MQLFKTTMGDFFPCCVYPSACTYGYVTEVYYDTCYVYTPANMYYSLIRKTMINPGEILVNDSKP